MCKSERLRWLLRGITVLAIIGACATQPALNGPGNDAGRGLLRVLVTDKPYPVDLLTRAEVTITRVEVRRANVDAPAICTADAECDDGLFCTGLETCNANGFCVAGTPACTTGQVCTEDTTTCGPCAVDADCDDGRFCNGTETCGSNGLCVAGDAACADEEDCLEDADTCGLLDDDDSGTPGRPFVVIFEGEKRFDLLLLQNGQTDLLADATIPAGTYTQMRVFVTAGEVELVDGRVFPLTVPSGARSGIKLNFTFTVGSDEATTLLLDVDLSRAFTPIPGGRIDSADQIREFKFAPSLAMRLVELTDTGAITGAVEDGDGNALPDVLVTALQDGAEISGTVTDATGAYTLIGLPAGTYTLEFSKSGFVDDSRADVAVTAADTVAMDPVTLARETAS